ncbi:MAG: methyltransferase domain-containing protein [Chthoniobacterales bacterium]
MENPPLAVATHEEACAKVASRFSRPWLRYYVASKLRTDPVFPAAHELLRELREPLLDVGCGIGLLPFYLRERGFEQPITGLDLDGRKVREGKDVAAGHYKAISLIEHDVRTALPQFRGNIAVLDLLHYLEPSRQQSLLSELAAFVPPGATLLLRDSLRDGSVRFWLTYAAEIFAQTVLWNLSTPLHFPTRASLNEAFAEEGFAREERPAHGRTPFNNRLFIFRRKL